MRDEKGKFLCQYSDTLLFNADESKEIRVQVPGNARSGTYISHTRAADISKYAKHTVIGLSAGLNSFTLKEKYFDTETVDPVLL
jgi:hypothetical protein